MGSRMNKLLATSKRCKKAPRKVFNKQVRPKNAHLPSRSRPGCYSDDKAFQWIDAFQNDLRPTASMTTQIHHHRLPAMYEEHFHVDGNHKCTLPSSSTDLSSKWFSSWQLGDWENFKAKAGWLQENAALTKYKLNQYSLTIPDTFIC